MTGYAERLLDISDGEGKIVIFADRDARWKSTYDWSVANGAFLNIETSKGVEGFAYHSVYTDGRYFYDPFVSDKPLTQSEYTNSIRALNPNGFSWRIYDPNSTNFKEEGGVINVGPGKF